MLMQPGDAILDYSYARPNLTTVRQRGFKGLSRYLTSADPPKPGATPKYLTPPEVDAIWAAQLGLMCNLEESSTGMLKIDEPMYVRGVNAMKAVHAPEGEIIVVSHDTPAWNSTVPLAFERAFHIFADNGYKGGFYGSKQCGDALVTIGLTVSTGWATNALAWGGGRWPDAHVLQGARPSEMPPGAHMPDMSGLGSVDGNMTVKAFHAWYPGSIDYPPAPPTPVVEDDMPIVSLLRSNTRQMLVVQDGGGITIVKGFGFDDGVGDAWPDTILAYGPNGNSWPTAQIGNPGGNPTAGGCSEATIDYWLKAAAESRQITVNTVASGGPMTLRGSFTGEAAPEV